MTRTRNWDFHGSSLSGFDEAPSDLCRQRSLPPPRQLCSSSLRCAARGSVYAFSWLSLPCLSLLTYARQAGLKYFLPKIYEILFASVHCFPGHLTQMTMDTVKSRARLSSSCLLFRRTFQRNCENPQCATGGKTHYCSQMEMLNCDVIA